MNSLSLFFEPTALALVLVYGYGVINRSRLPKRYAKFALGVIFGVLAVAAMWAPIPLADGVIIDMRNLFVGLAAAFLGPVAAVVTLAIAVVARVAIGGSGMLVGVVAMGLATGLGLSWAKWVRPRATNTSLGLMILGLMISCSLFAAIWLPVSIQATFWNTLAPWLILFYMFGSFLLGHLITYEHKLLREADVLRLAVTRDPLTQLLNRDTIMASYDEVHPNAHKSSGTAMLCIDVDNFKQINDSYGHLAGDQVLIQITQRMSKCLRPGDAFARMSGDEFVIVLSDLSDANAQAVAMRCQNNVSHSPINVEGRDIKASVSIGCTWTVTRPPFLDLRLAADEALYKAKERGRNCVAFEKLTTAHFPDINRPFESPI